MTRKDCSIMTPGSLRRAQLISEALNRNKSHTEDDDVVIPKPCLSREHNPPGHLYVPPGKVHIHVCPMCGYTVKIRGSGAVYY